MLDRATWYVRAQLRARRFGFPFVRRKWFRLPRRLRMNGAAVALDWPPEQGMRAGFIEVFLGDDYGLEIIADQDGAATRRVLDVGANVGWFALAARSHFPGAAIHAYEPNAAAAAFLRRNTEALGVVAHPEAVGASAGRVSLSTADGKSRHAHTADGATSLRLRSSTRSPASAAPIWSSSIAKARSGRSWTIPRRGPACGG